MIERKAHTLEKNKFLRLVKNQFILRGLLYSYSAGYVVYVRLLAAFPREGKEATLYEFPIVIHLNKSATAEVDHGEYGLFKKDKRVTSLDNRIKYWLNPSTVSFPCLQKDDPVVVGRLTDLGRPYHERAFAEPSWPISLGDHIEQMGIGSPRWMQIYARILGELAHYDPSRDDDEPGESAQRARDLDVLKDRFHSFIETLNSEGEKFGLETN